MAICNAHIIERNKNESESNRISIVLDNVDTEREVRGKKNALRANLSSMTIIIDTAWGRTVANGPLFLCVYFIHVFSGKCERGDYFVDRVFNGIVANFVGKILVSNRLIKCTDSS